MLEAWVGLRPGRPCARIEKEVMKFKDKVGRERSVKVSRGTLCFIAILAIKTLVIHYLEMNRINQVTRLLERV